MPIKNFGKEIKDSLRGTVDAVREKVKNIDTAEIKEDIHNTFETVKDKVSETGGKANEQMKKWFLKKDSSNECPTQDLSCISVKKALKIIYYLMAADGEIFHGEEEKFDEIGKELDPNFAQTKTIIVDECKARLALAASTEEAYADILRSGVDHAISSYEAEENFISSKLLVWNLLTIAYSDESYNEAEQHLIDYTVEKLNVDKTIYLEMQSSILTIFDLEKELVWIKSTNKPYLTIESHVNEINSRRTAIMESIAALIFL